MYRTLALTAFITLAGVGLAEASHIDSPLPIKAAQANDDAAQETSTSVAVLPTARNARAIDGLTLADVAANVKWRRETFSRLVTWNN